MFIPNSSFSIAVMNNDVNVAWHALAIVKVYLIVYSIVEYPYEWKCWCMKVGNKIVKCCKKKELNI